MDAPIVVMGVAGCGKTTVGRLLAAHLGVPYAEADEHHPPANLAKMADGIPLTDADRDPWLTALGERIAAADGALVVSCSALKRRYRDLLRRADPRVRFVHLTLDRRLAGERVTGRVGHFMPASLVDSQFADLEPLQDDEAGLSVRAEQRPEQIVAEVLARL